MRTGSGVRRAVACVAGGLFLTVTAACGGYGHSGHGDDGEAGSAGKAAPTRSATTGPGRSATTGPGRSATTGPGSSAATGPGSSVTGGPGSSAADPTRVPDVGDRLLRRIPADSRQVVAVYGDGKDSADATVVLYTKHGSLWERTRSWPAHVVVMGDRAGLNS